MNFTRLGCFSNLVIFSYVLIDLIYFGFFLNNHYFAALCVCCLACQNNWFMHSQVSTTSKYFGFIFFSNNIYIYIYITWDSMNASIDKKLLCI